MTYGEIEAKVRLLVNDAQEPYRFSQYDVFGAIFDAVSHLRNINPAEMYGAEGLLDEEVPEPADGTDVRIDRRHVEAVVKYAAHLVYQLDMSDTVNMQISETLRTRAEALMQL